MMSKGPWSDEKGNATAGLLVLVGGISLVLAQNEMRSVDAKRQKAKVEMAISQSTLQNNSSLQLAARVLKGSQAGQAAPVHLNPYILGPVCDQNRQLQATQGSTWQSTTDSIVIRNYSNNQLQSETDTIFNRLRSGQSPGLTPADSNTLRVLGYKCSADPLKPYLVEGVYVEARTQDAQNKTMLAKALLPMDAPPPSDCRFYVQDTAGNMLPPTGVPDGSPVLLPDLNGTLNFECNNVVTRAFVYDLTGGTVVAQTTTDPVTPANRIDAAYKALVPAIALSSLPSGTSSLRAVAEQVDGSQLNFFIEFDLSNIVPPGPPPETCEYRCDSVSEVWACTTDYLVHRPGYQHVSPANWVCYQCGYFYGFDPKQNCASVGVVGERGNGGCFVEDTRITMKDGKEKEIKDIRPGDEVWNPLVGRAFPVKNVIKGPEHFALYEVHAGGNRLKVTSEHPFMTKLGIMGAKDLRVGDLIQHPTQGWQAVAKLEVQPSDANTIVWNLELDVPTQDENHHMLLANGVLTGDHYLQKRVRSRQALELFGGL
jgi:hypothetical protein